MNLPRLLILLSAVNYRRIQMQALSAFPIPVPNIGPTLRLSLACPLRG